MFFNFGELTQYAFFKKKFIAFRQCHIVIVNNLANHLIQCLTTEYYTYHDVKTDT